MNNRTSILIVAILAHVAGSYGVLVVNCAANDDDIQTLFSHWDAPVNVLPLLVQRTIEEPDPESIIYWIGYVFPASVVVAAYIVWREFRKRRKGMRGFPVEPIKPP